MSADLYKKILECQIELRVKLPGELLPVCVPYTIGAPSAECFRPLPKDREVPFMPRSAELAMEMQRQRREIVEHAGKELIHSLLDYIQSKDPQHGYSPEEWKEINKSK